MSAVRKSLVRPRNLGDPVTNDIARNHHPDFDEGFQTLFDIRGTEAIFNLTDAWETDARKQNVVTIGKCGWMYLRLFADAAGSCSFRLLGIPHVGPLRNTSGALARSKPINLLVASAMNFGGSTGAAVEGAADTLVECNGYTLAADTNVKDGLVSFEPDPGSGNTLTYEMMLKIDTGAIAALYAHVPAFTTMTRLLITGARVA